MEIIIYWTQFGLKEKVFFDAEIARMNFNLDNSFDIEAMLNRILLNEVLFKDFRKATEQLYTYNRFGKPFLLAGPFFSLSSCKDIHICVISENSPVGIDIEYKVNLNGNRWIFNALEFDRYEHSKDRYHVLKSWVKKEAVLKLIGAGLNLPPNQFSTLKNVLIHKDIKIYLKTSNFIDRYYLCVATYFKCKGIINKYIPSDKLINSFFRNNDKFKVQKSLYLIAQ